MFRRVLAVAALVGGMFAAVPSLVNAESAGGVDGTTTIKMGQIAAGNGFTCMIVDSGKVACSGGGSNGQMGDGTGYDKWVLTLVNTITTATQVAAGADHVCALLADTSVMCWGRNNKGQLGNGDLTSQTSPTAVCSASGCPAKLTGVTAISAGDANTCAVMSDATARCWGLGANNQLGNGGNSDSSLPVTVSGLSGVTKVDVGSDHSCALKSDKSMRCWGTDTKGALGNSSVSASAENVTAISAAQSIAVFGSTSCAIEDSTSYVRCWGSNSHGEHGIEGGGPGYLTYDNNTHDASASTATYGSPFTAVAIAGTDEAACAIRTDSTMYCWGALQLEGGARAGASPGFGIFSIEPVTGITGAVALAMGNDHVCVLLSSGSAKCWGNGSRGQLARVANTSSTSAAVDVVVPTWRTLTFPALSNMTMASADAPLQAVVSSGPTGVDYTYDSASTGICSIESPNGIDYSVHPLAAGTCTISAKAIGVNSGGVQYSNIQPVTRSFQITNAAPSVSLNSASSVGSSTATLTASVNAANQSTAVMFRYATNQSMTNATSVASTTVTGRTALSRSVTLTQLNPGTTYYFTVDATNATGTTSPIVQSFTTLGGAPVALTGAPTSVSSGRATLNGTINPSGIDTAVWFTIGQKSDLSDGTKIEFRTLADNAVVDVSVTASGLAESAKYYFRLESSNVLGTSKGDIVSFTAARPVGLSINDADEFTNKKSVTLFATGPSGATQVIVSNDGGFSSSQTFSLTNGYTEVPWTLVASRDERLPKTVYARFVQRFGTQSANYSDDIILDTTAPTMTSASGTSTSTSTDNVTVQSVRISAAKGAVKLTVRASDKNSGIGKVQVKGSSGGSTVDVTTGSPKATSRTVKVNTTKKKLWVRVVDRAGNVSKWVIVTVK